MIEIHFDSKSGAWSKDMSINRFFVARQCDYLIEKFYHKGYIYLNDIYESLCIRWNPDNENVCCGKDGKFLPAWDTKEDEIIITIN